MLFIRCWAQSVSNARSILSLYFYPQKLTIDFFRPDSVLIYLK